MQEQNKLKKLKLFSLATGAQNSQKTLENFLNLWTLVMHKQTKWEMEKSLLISVNQLQTTLFPAELFPYLRWEYSATIF